MYTTVKQYFGYVPSSTLIYLDLVKYNPASARLKIPINHQCD